MEYRTAQEMVFLFLLCSYSWNEMAPAPDVRVLGSQHCSPGITFCCWQPTKRELLSPKTTLLELQPFSDLFASIPPPSWPLHCSKPRSVQRQNESWPQCEGGGWTGGGAATIYSYSKFQVQNLKLLWHQFYIWKSLPGASSWTEELEFHGKGHVIKKKKKKKTAILKYVNTNISQ